MGIEPETGNDDDDDDDDMALVGLVHCRTSHLRTEIITNQ